MCRMVGRIAVDEEQVSFELLDAPHSLRYLAQHGCQPKDPSARGPHNDGCGIAWLSDGEIEVEKRSRENAWDETFVSKLESLSASVFIAHNRLASESLAVSVEGAHPFTIKAQGREYALCHNGTVNTFVAQAKARGTSDSKILLEKLILADQPNEPDQILARVSQIAQNASFTSMSSLLITENQLFAWRIFDPSTNAELRDRYYTLYLRQTPDSVTLCSEPLDDGEWKLIPNNTFLHFSRRAGAIHVEKFTLPGANRLAA